MANDAAPGRPEEAAKYPLDVAEGNGIVTNGAKAPTTSDKAKKQTRCSVEAVMSRHPANKHNR